MSGYSTCKWTCGECGDSYEADGVVGDLKVDRWMRQHKEQHRIAKLSPAEREAHDRHEAEVMLRERDDHV